MTEHLLIATDGSELADHGLTKGLQLAKALGARATVLTVTLAFPMPIDMRGMGAVARPDTLANYEATQKAHADEILTAAKKKAKEMSVDVTTMHIPDAHAAEAILSTAKDKGCTMIVMASHGRRGIGRILMGSQTTEVLAHSPVPVLVVR
jgi:nucleotide-binding universal stress UspA family protein